ncbi:MAG: BamA/TamA family outer membrane protein [Myxococcota bacterium]|nr:BamA/TamA family outer membrane protein [Myxococcota bacterium]
MVTAIALLLTLGASVVPARAGTDPDREWFTLETDHFAIHGYDGGLAFARRVAAHAEVAYEVLNERLGWTPRERVHIRVVDDVDASNGFASVIPYNQLTFLAFPPTMDSDLAYYDDWVRMLVFHEYAHIVHLDNAEEVPEALNTLFGKAFKPNSALPRWFTEGVATWAESASTAGGRVGSTRYEMVLRTAALADALPTIDAITGPPLQVPRATSWYLYGSTLIDHIVRHAGEAALRDYLTAYGRRLIPYAMNILARRHTGKDLATWWEEMLTEVRQRARATKARVEAAGLVTGVARTTSGESKYHPRFTADGRGLLYVRADGHTEPRLVVATLDKLDAPLTVSTCDGGCGRFDLSRDGRQIFMSTTRPYRRVNSYRDIIRLPFREDNPRGGGRRLTTGARAGDPWMAADGRALWTVSTAWGETWLQAFDPVTGDEVARWTPPTHARVDRPLPHPDGKRLFATMHHEANRDLIEITLSDGRWRRLTHGASMEIDPTLSRDGRWLVYASDVTGIYNLYARDVSGESDADGRVFQLTNVLTGAFEPCLSPDGKTLAYVAWTAHGDDIFTLPFAPTEGRPASGGDTRAPRAPVAEAPDPITDGPTPYSPLSTVLPRSWYPVFAYDSAGLTTLGLYLGGIDITRRLSAVVAAEWDVPRGEVSAYGTLGLSYGFPDIRITLGRYARDHTAHYADRPQFYREEVFHGRFDVSVPMPDPVAPMALAASLSTEVRRGFQHAPVSYHPDGDQPAVPPEGVTTSFRLSWSFDTTGRDAWSISDNRGASGAVSLRFSLPVIGADRTTYELTYRLRHYLMMPWHDEHVLSLGIRGGFAGGVGPDVETFAVGGVPRRDLVNDLFSQAHAGSVWLRGFAENAFSGTSYHLATVEYRLPILRWRRGLDTLPVFARDLTAALFSDVALVHDEDLGSDVLDHLHAGVGVELRMKTDLLFGFGAHFRLGYAFGIGPGGFHHVYLVMAPSP